MSTTRHKLTLDEWDGRHAQLRAEGLREPWYGGPLGRHVLLQGDHRLRHLVFDDSAAALRLWNFLLTENQRLSEARTAGETLVGTMKDLGTVPVIAYSLAGVRAFYPDGAWWTPCLMECSDGLLQKAECLGIDASFCPVRAMLAAFESNEHFPMPDLLVCSAGAVCDDFSAIAQRLEHRGYPVEWWEIPRRRAPEPWEMPCRLPGGAVAPRGQVELVRDELRRVTGTLGEVAGAVIDDTVLRRGIRRANQVRQLLSDLRREVYGAGHAPLPALEMLICEMLAIHFCSDFAETVAVLDAMLQEARQRLSAGDCVTGADPVRVFWVNPVADLRAMNCLEEWGGHLCGTDYMFTHALDPIPENAPPFEALACAALADPMVGSAEDRANRIADECRVSGAEALVISRVPGASHCAHEGATIRQVVQERLGLPTVEIEVPTLSDALLPALSSRLQALIETARCRGHSAGTTIGAGKGIRAPL